MKLIKDMFAKKGRIHHGISPRMSQPSNREIVFAGRNRVEAKRQMIRFWSEHQNRLGMGLHEFTRCCALMDDERTIVFHPMTTIARIM